MQLKQKQRLKRRQRIRAKIKGSKICPRLSVFRSHEHIYVQLIDDEIGKTLLGLNDFKLKKAKKKMTKLEIAKELGKELAKLALKQKITKILFDRGGYKYHGRVKAIAQGAREGGLKF